MTMTMTMKSLGSLVSVFLLLSVFLSVASARNNRDTKKLHLGSLVTEMCNVTRYETLCVTTLLENSDEKLHLGSLVTEMCNATKNEKLCVSTLLELGPQKFLLSPKGIFLAIIKAVKRKATSILNDIEDVIAVIPQVEEPLMPCFMFYHDAVNDYIPEGVEALEHGDAKTAIKIISKTVVGAYHCEKSLISTGDEFADLLKGRKWISGPGKFVCRVLVMALKILSKLV